MRNSIFVIEGEVWPRELMEEERAGQSIEVLEGRVASRLAVRLRTYDTSGRCRVGHGVAGYLSVGGTEVHVVPKCFSLGRPAADWGKSAPRFLAVSQNLHPSDVYITGRGVFAPGNFLLPWWADYFSGVLWRALHSGSFLRYEPFSGPLSYVRGDVVWARQAQEWFRGEARVWCRFRRYQADNVLNRLLKWAAGQFIRIARAGRGRLASSIAVLDEVGESLPAPRRVETLRVPAVLPLYEEPLEIARALYFALYPSLARGEVPAPGFLINMPHAFEGFVDGLVRRAVTVARRKGRAWVARSQQQSQLAFPEPPATDAYYTRPDNIVWEISTPTKGVVIDAKYKGSAREPSRYPRPEGRDFYQVLASCVARGWSEGLVIAPATTLDEPGSLRRWSVRVPGLAEGWKKIRLAMLKVDLGALDTDVAVQELVDRVFEVLDGALS